MPDITLSTTAANATKLQTVVNYYNALHETNLTIKQWIVLMVRESYQNWNAHRLISLQPPVPATDDVTIT